MHTTLPVAHTTISWIQRAHAMLANAHTPISRTFSVHTTECVYNALAGVEGAYYTYE